MSTSNVDIQLKILGSKSIEKLYKKVKEVFQILTV